MIKMNKIQKGLGYLALAGAALLVSCGEQTEPTMARYSGKNSSVHINGVTYMAHTDSTGKIVALKGQGHTGPGYTFVDEEGESFFGGPDRILTFSLPDSTGELVKRFLATKDSLEFQIDATMFEQRQARKGE